MIVVGRPRPPQFVKLSRQSAGRAHDHRVVRTAAPQGADDLRIGGQTGARRVRCRLPGEIPASDFPLDHRHVAIGAPSTETFAERAEHLACIAHHRRGFVLAGVIGGNVDLHHAAVRCGEQGARAGGEVLQSRAYTQDQIGLRRGRVRASGAGHADGAEIQRMIPRQCALPRLRFGDGNCEAGRESGERRFGAAVVNSAAGDDQRRTRGFQPGRELLDLAPIRRLAANAPHAAPKKRFRIVVRFRLHILAKRQCHRTASGRVQQGIHGARQRVDQLLRTRDAVEVAGNRPEAIVGRDGAVGEVFDLLQHRIGAAAGEDIARQKQHGQSIGMRQGRRGHHIGRARPN